MASPMTRARSRLRTNIVPMMNGMSMRVSPSDWPRMVRPVRTTVAAKPQRRMLCRFTVGGWQLTEATVNCQLSTANILLLANSVQEIVVITGASAGVGRAAARAFGARRAKVGLIARGRDGLEAAKREIEA